MPPPASFQIKPPVLIAACGAERSRDACWRCCGYAEPLWWSPKDLLFATTVYLFKRGNSSVSTLPTVNMADMRSKDELMDAIVWKGKCHVEVQRVPKPKIEQAADVVVKIDLCGLCGSDMHPYHCREQVKGFASKDLLA